MNRTTKGFPFLLLLTLAGASVIGGCDDKPAAPLAPTASALAPTKPATAEAKKLTVDKASSKIEFMMDAPQEKIRGRVSGATEGEIQVDPSDLTKTTGLLTVDISGLEIFQTVADESGKFGEEKKQPTQNEHARTWLEISNDAPEDVRKQNSRVEFAIRSIEEANPKDITKVTGATRKATIRAKGDFLLHGRKAEKVAELEATFTYEGDKLASVAIKSVKPFGVGLAEHDVKPRDGFGKIAKGSFNLLGTKVAETADIRLDLRAKPQS